MKQRILVLGASSDIGIEVIKSYYLMIKTKFMLIAILIQKNS